MLISVTHQYIPEWLFSATIGQCTIVNIPELDQPTGLNRLSFKVFVKYADDCNEETGWYIYVD